MFSDLQNGIGLLPDLAIGADDHDAVAEVGQGLGIEHLVQSRALQGCVSEALPLRIVMQRKADGPVAQTALAIEEQEKVRSIHAGMLLERQSTQRIGRVGNRTTAGPSHSEMRPAPSATNRPMIEAAATPFL